MSKIRKAIVHSSIMQYILKAIALFSIVIFARILTPEELGIYAIAGSIALVASELRLFGTSNYLVREKNLSQQKVSSGIGLTILISWSLGIMLILSSSAISSFYHQADLNIIFKILSISFFLAPFISIPSSLLSRELRYHDILKIRLSAGITTFLVSIFLVLNNYSYFSLAWGSIIGMCVQVIMLINVTTGYKTWPPSFKNIQPIIKFGFYATLSSVLQRLSVVAPDLIIGKLGTPSQVAFFSRGAGFLDFLTQVLVMGIKPVALPYLSQVKRDGEDIAKAYLKATLLLGSICWPVILIINITSYPIIMILFGEQWVKAVSIASILSFWALFRAIHTLSNPLLITTGNENIMLFKEFFTFLFTALAIFLSFPYGLNTIAWSLVLVSIFDFLITSWSIYKAINISITQFLYAMRLNIYISITCWLVIFIFDLFINFETASPWYSFMWILLTLPITWILSIYWFKHPIYDEIIHLLPIRQQKYFPSHGGGRSK